MGGGVGGGAAQKRLYAGGRGENSSRRLYFCLC